MAEETHAIFVVNHIDIHLHHEAMVIKNIPLFFLTTGDYIIKVAANNTNGKLNVF